MTKREWLDELSEARWDFTEHLVAHRQLIEEEIAFVRQMRRDFPPLPCEPAIWPVPGSLAARLLGQIQEAGGGVQFRAQIRRLFTPDVQDALRGLPYQAYLASPYWAMVQAWLVYCRGACCEDCGAKGRLDIHHLSYEPRGAEMFHLSDVRLVCRRCHDVRHGNVEEGED